MIGQAGFRGKVSGIVWLADGTTWLDFNRNSKVCVADYKITKIVRAL